MPPPLAIASLPEIVQLVRVGKLLELQCRPPPSLDAVLFETRQPEIVGLLTLHAMPPPSAAMLPMTVHEDMTDVLVWVKMPPPWNAAVLFSTIVLTIDGLLLTLHAIPPPSLVTAVLPATVHAVMLGLLHDAQAIPPPMPNDTELFWMMQDAKDGNVDRSLA